MSIRYHVAPWGEDSNPGTAEQPFRRIQRAAEAAYPGDRIIVHGGTYREWVNPLRGGTGPDCPVVYEAAPGEHPVIKGSERITDWKPVRGTVWKAQIPNEIFGDWNPYAEEIRGDWFVSPRNHMVHTGEVYLNGRSFYEAESLEEVFSPTPRSFGCQIPAMNQLERIRNPEDTLYRWFAVVTDDVTILYANFRGSDPNRELTEINVRKSCFYPVQKGIHYITLRGFELAQAATPWAPPTADQPGLVGPHWSKGWIIENNLIHDAKCSAVSLGKDSSTGDGECSRIHRKPGYQYQMEATFLALGQGWSKDNVGSHVVRGNTIYNCGQNAIVGNLGGVFSKITGNHIHHIGSKHEFYGHEIAGIKLHAPIDAEISGNCIHDCTMGIWLDWQAQGVRVTRNLLCDNYQDFLIEVCHGPHLVDNNIFGSPFSLHNCSWGGAYVNNLIFGIINRRTVLDRATPYHFPHSTQVKGTTFVYGGDDRWIGNLFLGQGRLLTEDSARGTQSYNGHPASREEYLQRLLEQDGDVAVFRTVKDPVSIARNVYLGQAAAYDLEQEPQYPDADPGVSLVRDRDGFYLEIQHGELLQSTRGETVTTETLGTVRIAEEGFENPDGSPLVLDRDYLGMIRIGESPAGPLSCLNPGYNRIPVWPLKAQQKEAGSGRQEP